MVMQDTIAAISTPLGNGAIGIIRLSGPDVIPIMEGVWRGKVSPHDFRARQIYLGYINNLTNGTPIDQVIVFLMKAPSSYTGEDLIEVQGHGGQVVLEALLKNFIASGARLAEPGEFTKRAFLNGRIDLAQAEAVADLIQAANSRAAALASRQLEGRLSEYVKKLRNDLKVLRAQMEAMIDFPEDEDVQGLRYDEAAERTGVVQAKIHRLLTTYEEGRSFREGVRVAIVGKPNVGKSSLFNALLQEDRSIVHQRPGTTRDLIEEVLDLQGLPVRFIDTAGLRESDDGVESEGIRRAEGRLKQADLILAVVDSSRPFDRGDEMVLEVIAEKGGKTFYIYNKTDLPPLFLPSQIGEKVGAVSIFPLSAKEGTGIDPLKQAIFHHFVKGGADDQTSDLVLTNLRHQTAMQRGLDALEEVLAGCREKRSLEFLVADLSVAMNFLGEVTGEVTNDEILGEIFSKFCIGK